MGFLDAVLGALKSFLAWATVQVWYVVAAGLELVMQVVGWASTTVPYPKSSSGSGATAPAIMPSSASGTVWGNLADIYMVGGSSGISVQALVYFIILMALVGYGFARIIDVSFPNYLYSGSISPGMVFWWFFIAIFWWPIGTIFAMFGQILTNSFLCFGSAGLAVATGSGGGSVGSVSCGGGTGGFLTSGQGVELMKNSVDLISSALSSNPSFFVAAIAVFLGAFVFLILIGATIFWMIKIWLMYIMFMAMPIMFAIRPLKVLPGLKFLGTMGEKVFEFWAIFVFMGIPAAILAAVGIIVTHAFSSSLCTNAAPMGVTDKTTVSNNIGSGSAGKFSGEKYVSNPLSSIQDVTSATQDSGPVLISRSADGGVGIISNPELVQSGSGACSGSAAGQLTLVLGGLMVPLIVALGPWIVAIVAAKAGVNVSPTPLDLQSKLDPREMKETAEDKAEATKEYGEAGLAEGRKARAGFSQRETEEFLQENYDWDEDRIEDERMISAALGSGAGRGARGARDTTKKAGAKSKEAAFEVEKGVRRVQEEGVVSTAKSKAVGTGSLAKSTAGKARYGNVKESLGDRLDDAMDLEYDPDDDSVKYDSREEAVLAKYDIGEGESYKYDSVSDLINDKAKQSSVGQWYDRRQQVKENPHMVSGNMSAAEVTEDKNISVAEIDELDEAGVFDEVSSLSSKDEIAEVVGEKMELNASDDFEQSMKAAMGGVLDKNESTVDDLKSIVDDSISGPVKDDIIAEIDNRVETDDRGRIKDDDNIVDELPELLDEMEDRYEGEGYKSDTEALKKSYAKNTMAPHEGLMTEHDSKEEWVEEKANMEDVDNKLRSRDEFDEEKVYDNMYDSGMASLMSQASDESGEVDVESIRENRNWDRRLEAVKELGSTDDVSDEQIEIVRGSVDDRTLSIAKDLNDNNIDAYGSDSRKTAENVAEQVEEEVNDEIVGKKAEELADSFQSKLHKHLEAADMKDEPLELSDVMGEISDEVDGEFEEQLQTAVESADVGLKIDKDEDGIKIEKDEFQTDEEVLDDLKKIKEEFQETAEKEAESGKIEINNEVDARTVAEEKFDSEEIKSAIGRNGEVNEEKLMMLTEKLENAQTMNEMRITDEVEDEGLVEAVSPEDDDEGVDHMADEILGTRFEPGKEN